MANQQVKEFSAEKVTVSSNKLLCSAWREELALKKSIIEHHVRSEKHATGKEKLVSKDKLEQDILKP